MRWWWVGVGVGWGCGGPRIAVDEARVCVGEVDPGGPVVLADGDVLGFTATATGGCHTADLAVTCEVVLEAPGVLAVTTTETWIETEPLALSCESVLVVAVATCVSPPLPAGSYTVHAGAAPVPFEVPGTLDGCLP